jgi:SAM-dependent methyltransferase
VHYTGVDITPKMIEAARARFPEARFETQDVLSEPWPAGSYDYVVSSGIFYRRKAEPFGFLQRMVAEMFRLCRRGVAFNSLSAWAANKDGDEFYADPVQTLGFCRGLTSRLALRHDYHPRDFTVFLYKEGTRSTA